MKIILASASPRRQELLRYIVTDFDIIPADIDETLPADIPADSSAEYLAVKKAEHISAQYQDSLVIGSDTVVIIGDEILGKPVDEKDAKRMLRKLSGQVHTVVTGVCLSMNGRSESFSKATKVKFYPLSDKEILDYIATGEPMDKAGAYGIQGFGRVLIEGIEGDFFNVMGLPVASLKRKMEEFVK